MQSFPFGPFVDFIPCKDKGCEEYGVEEKGEGSHMALYRVGSTVNVHGFTVGPVYCVK